jgi:hypothetical protein
MYMNSAHTICRGRHLLVQLTTDNASNKAGGVRIGEEVGWVRFNLLQGEAGAGITAVGDDASRERPSHATH